LLFTLFRDRVFEVTKPEALIEAYCFQSDFYAKYDFQCPKGDDSFEYVRFIGARTKKSTLSYCKAVIDRHKDFSMFSLDLDLFLSKTPEVRTQLAFKLGELTHELDDIEGIGFSKATKILHTLYPEIIPMIDNPLQKEYKALRPEWKKGDWGQLFKDYYENFLVKETYDNLNKVYNNLSFLGLTKVRIFDILWWSFLKSKNLKDSKGENVKINWSTIKSIS